MIRPKGINALTRSRAPLWLILWMAGQEARLIWQDHDGFAVLERPLVDRARGGGLLLVAARWADRHWQTTAPFAIPLVLLLTSAACVPLRAYVAAIVLAIGAMLAVLVGMIGVVVRQGYELVRTFVRPRSEEDDAVVNLPYESWSLPLCHQTRDSRVDGFPGLIRLRLRLLIQHEVRDAAAELGGTVNQVPVSAVIVCLLDGATTPAMARRLAEASAAPASDRVAFMAASPTPGEPGKRWYDSGSFLPLYLSGMAVVIVVIAMFVPSVERGACEPGSCAGRPVEFESALRWLLQRVLLNDPPGLSPQTTQVWVLGWLVSVMALVSLPIAYLATKHSIAAYKRRTRRFLERHGDVTKKTRILLLVANTEERDAVLAAATADGRQAEAWPLKPHAVRKLPSIANTETFLYRCEQGVLGPGSAMLATSELIRQLQPSYVILVGICYGLRPDYQNFCDILVPTQVRVMDHRRIENGVEYVVGDRVSPSITLSSSIDVAEYGWTGSKVYYGPMLSMNSVINDQATMDALRDSNPGAIGGDMETGGVYAAAAQAGVDWIAIKAISDFGADRDYAYQDKAASTAAAFVLRLIAAGGLDEPPTRVVP